MRLQTRVLGPLLVPEPKTDLSLQVRACVCVCVRALVCVCALVCLRAYDELQLGTLNPLQTPFSRKPTVTTN